MVRLHKTLGGMTSGCNVFSGMARERQLSNKNPTSKGRQAIVQMLHILQGGCGPHAARRKQEQCRGHRTAIKALLGLKGSSSLIRVPGIFSLARGAPARPPRTWDSACGTSQVTGWPCTSAWKQKPLTKTNTRRVARSFQGFGGFFGGFRVLWV